MGASCPADEEAKDPAARIHYLPATARCGWILTVQLNWIQSGACERPVKEKKTHNFELAMPEHLVEQENEMVGSRYNLEFLFIAGQTSAGSWQKEFPGSDRRVDFST